MTNSTDLEGETLCDRYGISATNYTCQCDTQYNMQGVCRSSLLSWQQCSGASTSGQVNVDSNDDNSEATIEMVISFTKSNQQCQDVALPFLCLYLFPFCDCKASSSKYVASEEICEYARDKACSTEWNLVNLLYPSLLPECSDLPPATG